MPHLPYSPDQPFQAPQPEGGVKWGGAVTTAASVSKERQLAPAAIDPEQLLVRAYRPENLQVPDGPRLYQSNNTSVMNVQAAVKAATGLEMATLQNKVYNNLPSELVNAVQIPMDTGIKAVGTYRPFDNRGLPSGDRTAEPSLVLGLGLGWTGRDREVFGMAERMASDPRQQSVAVFIPDPEGDSYHFQVNMAAGKRPMPEELDKALSPIQDAYTLHLDEDGRVKAIDVLGMNLAYDEILQVSDRYDPKSVITVEPGTAYLVGADGDKLAL